jgi:aspartyl-tRNA(Asn)/glutamyl-tRNA(Gln) amidotransferase subunit C
LAASLEIRERSLRSKCGAVGRLLRESSKLVFRLTIFRMSSHSSAVTPDVVRRIAALARLRVPERELPVWTRQLDRIVSYIDQLRELPEDALAARQSGAATPLRSDSPRPGSGDRALSENAPATAHGFGVVPRVVGGEE